MAGALRGDPLTKPVLFVTNFLPRERVGAFAELDRREGIAVALYGGRLRHGVERPALPSSLSFPVAAISEPQAFALAASGRYRAVVVPTGGRVALPAGWLGARWAGIPVLLWASLWAHPLTPFHLLSYLPLRHLYRAADAVVAYGPHIARYVAQKGASRVVVAPQAVDNAFWSAPADPPTPPLWEGDPALRALYVGRFASEKGVGLLLDAWRLADLPPELAQLLLVGDGPLDLQPCPDRGILVSGPRTATELRSLYCYANLLIVPSVATRTFREPWGLVVNEAMNQGTAILASEAVGAVAGGLVRDGETGLVFPTGSAGALAERIRQAAADPQRLAQLGANGREAVSRYTFAAWAEGFSAALHQLGLSRSPVDQPC